MSMLPQIGLNTAASLPVPSVNSVPLPERLESHWYAASTCARHEKQVAKHLQQRGVDCFLPLYEAVHRWKDRRKRVELPLFPGYVFVRIALKDRLRVLEIPGVARFVGFDGHPYALPEDEMETLRRGLAQNLRTEPHPFLTVGRRVRIIHGPLAGLEGVLQRKRNLLRVVVSVDLIARCYAVDIASDAVQALR